MVDTISPLLQVNDLCTYFSTGRGIVKAVDGVSFEIYPGEVLAVVGESGSGKSVTAFSIMGLVPNPPGRVVRGKILFNGEDLTAKTSSEMTAYRGSKIAMIFQDPMTSLDPVFTIEEQMVEAIMQHRNVSHDETRGIAVDMLARVQIPHPEYRLQAYPFQLSGGLRQRVMIAMALSCQPGLLIADEPTTALDVTVQAQILTLLRKLQAEFTMAVLLITHDFGVVAKMANRVVVMYGGKIMESANANTVFTDPQHPYTRALLESRPKLGYKGRLTSISGTPPNLVNPLPGCPFANRCPEMVDACWAAVPRMRVFTHEHHVRCILRGE
jgi:oligopeptide/dipeptide ABC transporter ATP-binding protein